jgi:hypothetical protein
MPGRQGGGRLVLCGRRCGGASVCALQLQLPEEPQRQPPAAAAQVEARLQHTPLLRCLLPLPLPPLPPHTTPVPLPPTPTQPNPAHLSIESFQAQAQAPCSVSQPLVATACLPPVLISASAEDWGT